MLARLAGNFNKPRQELRIGLVVVAADAGPATASPATGLPCSAQDPRINAFRWKCRKSATPAIPSSQLITMVNQRADYAVRLSAVNANPIGLRYVSELKLGRIENLDGALSQANAI